MRFSSGYARWLAIGPILALALAVPTASSAATGAPHWIATIQAAPTDLHPGDNRDFYEIVAANDGPTPTSGPITVTDILPAGFTVNGTETAPNGFELNGMSAINEFVRVGFTKTEEEPFTGGCEQASQGEVVTVTCTTNTSVPSGRGMIVNINVNVPAGESASSVTDVAAVEGGGAESVHSEVRSPVTGWWEPVPFGASQVSEATGAEGVDTQATSHPWEFTTLMTFNVGSVDATEHCNEITTLSCAEVSAEAKNIEVALPAGMYGNPTAVPYCKQTEFEEHKPFGCPAASQVGGIYLYFYTEGTAIQYAPLYNIKPPTGQPAELGFTVSSLAHIPMFFHVRSDGDYGLTADLSNINQFDPVRVARVSIWGEPSDEGHFAQRQSGTTPGCGLGHPGCPSGVPSPKPFLSLPSDCAAGATTIAVDGDSWQEPGLTRLTESAFPAMTGCEALAFNPAISVSSSTPQAGAPAGYTVHLKVPQNEEPETLGTPPVRNVEVALPQGTVISSAAANGLTACGEAEFQKASQAKGTCPGSSKIGAVTVTTPLLAEPLTGSMFVAAPECSPCEPKQAVAGQLVHLYLEARGSGVAIKLAGHTRIDQSTGQLTTVFADNPQLPFSELTVVLEEGASAPLVNPSTCGSAIATAALTPWSSSAATSIMSPPIAIAGCTAPTFAPSLIAGATSATAGAFTGFHVTLAREDTDQPFGRINVTTPPGLLGLLKEVPECGAAQASDGTCPESSLIGTGFIVSGPGSKPLTLGGTKAYLTGPYAGAPFGLSIVTPTQAGPFVLAGNTGHGSEVVRAAISVDPHTARVTVTSDPLPQALDGIPVQLRRIDLDINRPGFMFNPTDCNPTAVNSVIIDAASKSASVSYPFQTHDCSLLPFNPTFKVSTAGHASKANGASLDVKVTSAGGPQSGGGEANIAKVKVNLPLQLPSRLSTLQKACVDSVFEANPGSCPAASVVGQATAVTPVLAHSLTGPAYLVSHAGAAFPDLEIVLQGEGITLVLDGNTQIKKGITSSIFRAVPDAPISSFDLVLPEGPHSVLATNLPAKAKQNLCGQTLHMPTVITGQNGAVVRQTTKIAITGCPRHKTKGKSKKH